MTTTSISIGEALFDRIATRASELKLSVSRFLAVAAEEYLASHPPEAWEDPLDSRERVALRGMREKYRATFKDSW